MTTEERVRAATAELAEALLALAREAAAPAAGAPAELLSVPEFARRAGIGRSTAYLLVTSGVVHSRKVRGRRLIPASEVGRLAGSA